MHKLPTGLLLACYSKGPLFRRSTIAKVSVRVRDRVGVVRIGLWLGLLQVRVNALPCRC